MKIKPDSLSSTLVVGRLRCAIMEVARDLSLSRRLAMFLYTHTQFDSFSGQLCTELSVSINARRVLCALIFMTVCGGLSSDIFTELPSSSSQQHQYQSLEEWSHQQPSRHGVCLLAGPSVSHRESIGLIYIKSD